MTSFKKTISVIMAVVMLLGVLSSGMIGIAAEFNANEQYASLAAALKNDYVGDLTNYNLSNAKLENETEGFNADANGFAYEHKVTAKDNAAGDILKAANRFYYILENILSTEYGVGLYDPGMIHSTVTARLKSYFLGSEEAYYEDFYGKRYVPTQEEVDAYNNAVSLLEAVGREVTQASLSSFRIYFMKKDQYSFYNVDTIIQYFLGNTLKINAGNWYHKYVFEVETSRDTWLTENGDITNLYSSRITVRKAIYELTYARTFNDTQTKAFYAFNQPELSAVWQDFGDEFEHIDGADNVSSDLTTTLTRGGQASAFMIRQTEDMLTIPYLLEVYNAYKPFIEASVSEAITDPVNGDKNAGETWDARFAKMNETQLAAVANANKIAAHMDELGSMYSNDALLSMFGENVGNMISLAYIIKPMSTLPERTVRGTAKYTVTTDKLNSIVRDIDNLVHNSDGDTATRVATIVKQFFNTNSGLFQGTQVQGQEFDDLKDMVSVLLNGMLFRDGIINKLVGLIYPMLCTLVKDKLLQPINDNLGVLGSLVSGGISGLLTYLLNNNDLAIYPNQLASNLSNKYGNKYANAVAVLNAAGEDWDKVNMEALEWGVDSATIDNKAQAFIDGFCAALGGFRLLLVTVMCGDEEYENDSRTNANNWHSKNQFTEYYDKLLINIGQEGAIIRSQGGYTKLVIPLLRCFGLQEQGRNQYNGKGYASSEEYHRLVDAHGDNCLRCIIEPIVYWATEVLAAQPFTELWKLLPNLIYFFTRTGTVEIADDWCDGPSEDDSHDNFTTCQTWSLATIMEHLHVDLTIFGIQTWSSSIAGFLGDKMSMLRSLNGLLNEFIDLSYIKGETGVMLPCAYANGSTVVLKDSVEYVTNPSAYPEELLYCYTYDDSFTAGNNSSIPQYVREKDDIHTVRVENPEYLKAPYKIPQIQEKKITSTTTEQANGTLADPNAIGVLNTAWNTIDVRNPGVVLLYVLRFVISALGYKYDISDTADPDLPYLIKCFGLDIDKELFQGLNLKDIIYNVMLHPDEAICALLELFYSNEQGDKKNSVSYTYGLNEINYHREVLMDKDINPTLTYGTPVRYSEYWTREYAQDTIGNAGELIKNVLLMLGKDEFKDGFGPYLKNLLNEKVFNNETVNKLFNMVYHLLGGLNDQVGFNIQVVLEAVYNITYNPMTIGNMIDAMLGYQTAASDLLKSSTTWANVFPVMTETDPISQEVHATVLDVNLDWGVDSAEAHHLTNHEAFLRVVSALLSPAAFLIKYLFRDQNIRLLNLIELDAYAGYHYAWIGLLEALSCPNVLTYDTYYEATQEVVGNVKIGDAKSIYYLLAPLGSLIDKIYEDPITNILNLIPNLLFFISIGGLIDLLNNLLHFAYVLLDILKPIVNGYDLLDGLLANIEIKDYKLNISLPLDIDFNALFSDLIAALVGDSINIGGLQLTLPYIDFHTLCCGKLKSYSSSEERLTVKLDSADGADLLTAVLRLVFEVIFMDENKVAVMNFVVEKAGTDEDGNPKLDNYDKATLLQLLDQLYTLMETYQVPDILLFTVYQLVTRLTPISSKLAPALSASGMTITDLFSNISDPNAFIAALTTVVQNMGLSGTELDSDGAVPNPTAAKSIFEKIRSFFDKIIDFFKRMFGIA